MLMPGPAPPPRPPPPQYHPKWEESVRQGSVFLRGGGGGSRPFQMPGSASQGHPRHRENRMRGHVRGPTSSGRHSTQGKRAAGRPTSLGWGPRKPGGS